MCLTIGKTQRHLPVHVINEYFHLTRTFVAANNGPPLFNDEEDLPRHFSFYDGTALYPWKENSAFTIIRSSIRGGVRWGFQSMLIHDSAAINRLDEVRSKQMLDLTQQLGISLVNQQAVILCLKRGC